ncbi:MAG: hypothetical protein M3478_13885 [Planctomycetota bacterium]|nr:hypothetical protein [Planctomycetota bacterium]
MSESERCRRCGSAVPASPLGVCPACLLAAALTSSPPECDVTTHPIDTPSPAPSLAHDEPLPHIPRYHIIEPIGVGGMGVVYKAEQRVPVRRTVAIKLTTIWKIGRGLRSAMRGEAPGRVFAIAMTWLGLYALLVFVTVLCLLATEPGQPGDRLLFLAVSAVSNVGLAHNPVSIVKEGMFVLSAAMLLGRLVPLAILWWVVAVTREDEEIPIG